MKKKIVLLGMMGTGKTTLGKMLSKKLQLLFFDTDNLIEKKCNMKIKKIFEKYGEKYFRIKEEKIVSKILLNKKSCIIALGGGTFLNKKLQNIILKKTVSIWLNADLNLIYKRCKKSNKRPLLIKSDDNNLKKTIQNLIKERYPIYSKAKLVVNTNKNPENLCDEIIKKITNLI